LPGGAVHHDPDGCVVDVVVVDVVDVVVVDVVVVDVVDVVDVVVVLDVDVGAVVDVVVVVVVGGVTTAVPEVISPVIMRSLSPALLVQALTEAVEGLYTVTLAGPGKEPVDLLVLTVVFENAAAAPFLFPFQTRVSVAPTPVNVRLQVSGLRRNDPLTVPLVMVIPRAVEVHLDSFPLTDDAFVPPPEDFSEGRKVTVAE
jgi:hypothetical protein